MLRRNFRGHGRLLSNIYVSVTPWVHGLFPVKLLFTFLILLHLLNELKVINGNSRLFFFFFLLTNRMFINVVAQSSGALLSCVNRRGYTLYFVLFGVFIKIHINISLIKLLNLIKSLMPVFSTWYLNGFLFQMYIVVNKLLWGRDIKKCAVKSWRICI